MTPKTNGGINAQKLQGEYTPLHIGVQPFSAKKICDRTARKWLYANENQHTAQTAKRILFPYVGFRCRYKKHTLSIFVVHRILLVL